MNQKCHALGMSIIVAMANNGAPSYLVIGLEDKTFADVGTLSHHYTTNDINQILAGKIDPPIAVSYQEFTIQGVEYALVEVVGRNPPYIVGQDVIHTPTDRKQTRITSQYLDQKSGKERLLK